MAKNIAFQVELEAGAMQEALRQLLPRRSVRLSLAKLNPLSIRYQPSFRHLEVMDAKHQATICLVPAIGAWPEKVQVGGSQLRNIFDRFGPKERITFRAEADCMEIQTGTLKLKVPRLDGEGKKGIAAVPLPPQPHTGPVKLKPDPQYKRVALNDTWAFSARVPMPQHRDKKKDGD